MSVGLIVVLKFSQSNINVVSDKNRNCVLRWLKLVLKMVQAHLKATLPFCWWRQVSRSIEGLEVQWWHTLVGARPLTSLLRAFCHPSTT